MYIFQMANSFLLSPLSFHFVFYFIFHFQGYSYLGLLGSEVFSFSQK